MEVIQDDGIGEIVELNHNNGEEEEEENSDMEEEAEEAEEFYDYEFVEPPPSRLICYICHLPCRDAQLLECCRAYCKSCLDKWHTYNHVAMSNEVH